MRAKWSPISIIFIALATIGLVYQLYFNPKGLFSMILIFTAVFLIFYALYRYLIKDQSQSKYKQAAKQSANRYKKAVNQSKANQSATVFPTVPSLTKNEPTQKLKATRSKHNFTVIEGNKGKKKDPFSS